MSDTIRVMLVDDHDLLRQGMALFLKTRDDLELVAEAENGAKAVERCKQLRPDVVLMDLMMPEMNGVEATRQIRECCPDTQVIVLTSFDQDNLVSEAIQAGALSYLLKNVSTDKLAEAIRAAHSGEATLSKEATQALVNAAQQPKAIEYDLTQRQQDVLALMVQGKTNHEIAHELTISISTVKKHVSNILYALGTDSRTHATAIAIQNGLIQDPNAP
jgi:two-component system, NarL family, response regulator LiaR